MGKYVVETNGLIMRLPKVLEVECSTSEDPIKKARQTLADMCVRENASFAVGRAGAYRPTPPGTVYLPPDVAEALKFVLAGNEKMSEKLVLRIVMNPEAEKRMGWDVLHRWVKSDIGNIILLIDAIRDGFDVEVRGAYQ